jgi:hypothetical protein
MVCPQGCLQHNPPCTCGYCTTNYHCPVCASKPAVKSKCRLQEETKAKLENLARERARREKEKEAQKSADELAEKVGDFWHGLSDDMTVFTVEDVSAACGSLTLGEAEEAGSSSTDPSGSSDQMADE